MGTQHRPSKRMKFKIDEEWEYLEAPMFCDFLAPEFVGNRLGGQVTEESSSSSFFNRTGDATGTNSTLCCLIGLIVGACSFWSVATRCCLLQSCHRFTLQEHMYAHPLVQRE